ncbi:hypothetical protein GOP47_0030267 [Adiantum capillus-veneris]|nr:hypothetical protein GOP47_0030267 [Adiantum capillus-veneris]
MHMRLIHSSSYSQLYLLAAPTIPPALHRMMIMNASRLIDNVGLEGVDMFASGGQAVESVIAVAGELGITVEMAGTITEHVLLAIDAGHHLPIAQALETFLSFGAVVEDLHIFEALSLPESKLRSLHLLAFSARRLLDKGASRELCAALSESNLKFLNWDDSGLDKEQEEMLCQAIISPGCSFEGLAIDSYRAEHHLKSLSSALTHPNCKIGHLAILGSGDAEALGDVLRDDKNRLLMLTLHGSLRNIPWQAMQDPTCKVEALRILGVMEEEVEHEFRRMLQAERYGGRNVNQCLGDELPEPPEDIVNLLIFSYFSQVIHLWPQWSWQDHHCTKPQPQFTLPASLQRHATTLGIGMGVLQYNAGRQAVICDIAGQAEFHAFHHYFVKGSHSNLFLVVCKVFTDAGIPNNMEQELKYWLRFISSHKALASRRKPKVLNIALNYHGNGDFNRAYLEPVNELSKDYMGLLDICKDGGDNLCFEMVALRVADVKQIKDAVGVALIDVLENHLLVPSLCQKVRGFGKLDRLGRMTRRRCCKNQADRQKRVVTIEELTESVLAAGDDGDRAARTSAVQLTMACMHDMGDPDEVLANSATLDMQWFVQELVGIFIQVSREDDWWWRRREHKLRQVQMQEDEYKVSMSSIVPKIEKMCSPTHLGYVLKALHKMGVLLPSDDNWNGTWSRTQPKKITVPALLRNEIYGTKWGSDGYIYWGRRMACKDQVCTLLPSGQDERALQES